MSAMISFFLSVELTDICYTIVRPLLIGITYVTYVSYVPMELITVQ